MARVAFYTFGVLHEPWGWPRVQGFMDRVPSVFASAETSGGFILRLKGGRPLGLMPVFFDPQQHAGEAQTVSVWTGT